MSRVPYQAWPALLTATVRPDAKAIAKLSDAGLREQQYLSTLDWMAKAETGLDVVIFCENSGADLGSFERLKPVFARNGRHLEVVAVPSPRSEDFQGKGWGEGALIRWALENVPTLASAEAFIKLTGRYRFLNLHRLNSIIRRSRAEESGIKFVCQRFSKDARPHVDSSLFWSDRAFYQREMAGLYKLVNDKEGTYLEHVLAQRLLELKREFKIGVLPIRPLVRGRRGWDGNPVMPTTAIIAYGLEQLLLSRSKLRYLAAEQMEAE